MPRRRLGRQLRDLRNQARMTTRAAAQHLEWSEAKIWRIETGQTSLRGLDVEAMCKVYGAPPEAVAPLTALAKETKSRGWWTGYSDVIGEGFEVYLGLEEAASRLFTYEDQLIPGLLQTESYARALLRAARPELSESDVERRVRLRLARQSLLTRDESPLRLDVLIGEAALWRASGERSVLAGQLDHLRLMSELPHVRIQMVPADAGYHRGIESGPFVLLEFPAPAVGTPEPPVVYVEAFTGPVYVDKAHEVDRYRAAFDSIRSVAVDARTAIDDARANCA
ncbi:helix-turn-helix domain-containing protein [Nocardia cyriacigeorgica]|uniref:helix-turn-helix domain-containing protein n=1 Tax=Nocardia cyriacigeorgica TaxID=135487 RepID=UPI002455AFBD|nr:helix-turn-helix transcriptional regulator [Nocardia cyriacigeorgica]